MKWAAAALLFGNCAVATQDHPIEKIITLLKGLSAQAESEGKTEAVAFTKFQYWCKTSGKTLSKAIAEEKDTIDSLSSKIDAKTKEKEALEKQIKALEDEIGKLDASALKALNARTKANNLYVEASGDLKSTITSVEACITALKDAKTQTSLLQAKQQFAKVIALVQTDPEDVMAMGDRAGHVKKYSFKGGNVIELLKQLLLKFEDDLVRTEKEETNSLNAYNLAKDARDNAKSAADDSKTEKGNLLGETTSELNGAKGDLSDTKDLLEADTGTLDSTEKSCAVKKSEWDERSEIRSGEIAAIETAVKILAKVGGVRTEAPGNPIPPPNPTSFVQLSESSDPKMKAVVYLRQQAQVLHAKSLERLAQQLASHIGDPFGQVTNMIEKMIFRLMAEQKDEDDHKNWCDKEIAKTEASIEDKEDKVESLRVKIEDNEATVSKLTEDIKDADKMIAKIISFMNEATEIRKTGKMENKLAIKDAQDAQTAVANAIAVLRDFYKSSGEIPKESWELLQKGVELPENPATWDASYTGVADADAQPDGIVTILEHCSEDFAKMEADTRAQEAADQDAYDSDMQENDIEKAKRSKEAEMKTNEKKRLVDKVNSQSKQKKHVADELEATQRYGEDLKPACVDGDSTYEDRKAARAKEIEALHKAQDILAEAFKEGDNAGFLQRKQIRRA